MTLSQQFLLTKGTDFIHWVYVDNLHSLVNLPWQNIIMFKEIVMKIKIMVRFKGGKLQEKTSNKCIV